MRCREPSKQILTDTRGWWDRAEARSAFRENFERMINCKIQVRRNPKGAAPACDVDVTTSLSPFRRKNHECLK